MCLYNNVFNMLWEHLDKFEVNTRNVKYPLTLLNYYNQYFKNIFKWFEKLWKSHNHE
jgi:hypothetical protein